MGRRITFSHFVTQYGAFICPDCLDGMADMSEAPDGGINPHRGRLSRAVAFGHPYREYHPEEIGVVWEWEAHEGDSCDRCMNWIDGCEPQSDNEEDDDV